MLGPGSDYAVTSCDCKPARSFCSGCLMAILLESGLVCSQCNNRVEEVVRYSKSEELRAMRSRGRETQSKQPTKRTDVIRRQQG